MARQSNFIDFYLAFPIWVDCLLIVVFGGCNLIMPAIFTVKFEDVSQLSLLSSLIGTSVSLAGFILAALTIIVSFKSNISARSPIEATNPLELLFSSNNYPKVIKVFKDAIIELTVVFIVLYVIWLLLESLDSKILFYGNLYCAIIMLLTLVRTLFVLFLMLNLNTPEET